MRRGAGTDSARKRRAEAAPVPSVREGVGAAQILTAARLLNTLTVETDKRGIKWGKVR